MFARYYGPQHLFRFLSVDPASESARLELPQSWNRYAYVLNNPIVFIDPDGRKDDRTEEDKRILEGGDVKKKSREAWDKSVAPPKKADRKEHVFNVEEKTDEDGNSEVSTTKVREGKSGTESEVIFTTDTTATVHTHPVKSVSDGKSKPKLVLPGPSEPDESAHNIAGGKTGLVTSYVIGKKAMWKFDPADGKSKKILTGRHFKKYMGKE